MQDLSTGQLVPLTPEQADAEAKRRSRIDQMFGELHKANAPTLAAYGEKLPPVEHRGPIFSVGEILEIKGGRFRIQRFNGSKMVLKSLPSASSQIVAASSVPLADKILVAKKI